MEPIQTTSLSPVAERMNRLRTRIHLESVSGIAASDKEAFLAFCHEWESSEKEEWKPSVALSAGQGNWLDVFEVYRDE